MFQPESEAMPREELAKLQLSRLQGVLKRVYDNVGLYRRKFDDAGFNPASVTSLDADFPFAYYVEQLLSLIGANWFKPESAEGTSCVVSFRVQRSGQVTDVKVDST